jgi:hypothetical protein
MGAWWVYAVAAGLIFLLAILTAMIATSSAPPTTGAPTNGDGKTRGTGDGGGLAPPAGAKVLETMRDVRFTESLVYPRGKAPEIKNIVEVAPRHFRFTLRHRWHSEGWYDGDRDLKWNEGRHAGYVGKRVAKSRAEITMASPDKPFDVGTTWLIGTTVRLAPDFVPSKGYCNIMQPLNHQSFLNLIGISGDVVTAALCVFKDGVGTPITVARKVGIKRGEWTTLVVRVKIAKNGAYALSINGDDFQGVAGIDTTKSGDRTPPFGGNWGLYGTGESDVRGKPLGDQTVEHRDMFVKKL